MIRLGRSKWNIEEESYYERDLLGFPEEETQPRTLAHLRGHGNTQGLVKWRISYSVCTSSKTNANIALWVGSCKLIPPTPLIPLTTIFGGHIKDQLMDLSIYLSIINSVSIYFLSVLLKYNLYTIKLIRCTVQWVLVNELNQVTTSTIMTEHFHHP